MGYSAWQSASRAIAFVFEHWEQELAEYGDYIKRLFAAKQFSSHEQVILFDRGVRNEVGGSQTLLLTDYQAFTSLYAATLQEDGVKYRRNRKGGGGNKSGSSKDEVCLHFNGQAGCRSQTLPASTVIPVWDVAKPVKEERSVSNQTESEVLGLRPKYVCHNLWTQDADPKVTVATWTHTPRPLHRPPQARFDNLPAIQTIKSCSDLFKIITPVKVSVLRHLTSSHPNPPFVDSVSEGLTNGFWPWANTICEGYPVTHDESKSIQLTPEKEEFLRNQIQHERKLGRVSDSFGKDLLPGMYCMPHYVVPKPHSTEWRLVNDLSAGPFSLNSMVDCQYISGYPLDNLSHLGEMLLRRLKEKPSGKFIVWKSDISEAYRICPMHKLWQLKQAIHFEGELSVDRVNMFGGSPSGAIFISVNSLVAWITKFKRMIKILEYVDDSFGVSESGEISYYAPYNCWFTTKPTQLLELWDKLGLPHK